MSEIKHIQAGDLKLGLREWGGGDTVVLFIHGNLASKEWIELAAPRFPRGVRTLAFDWRGCADSDKPLPVQDFSNYSIARHAADMVAGLDDLGVSFCHLATHSTGGIIAARMLLDHPTRFGRVLHLDPVSPVSIPFTAEKIAAFRKMAADPAFARIVMAATAPSLFMPESLAKGAPVFRPGVAAEADLFERILLQMRALSMGVWEGTPHALTREFQGGELARRMGEITNEQLVLWGELDGVIALKDMQNMVRAMPRCRLVAVPGIGHSMNLEAPDLFAGYYGAWFGGLSG